MNVMRVSALCCVSVLVVVIFAADLAKGERGFNDRGISQDVSVPAHSRNR